MDLFICRRDVLRVEDFDRLQQWMKAQGLYMVEKDVYPGSSGGSLPREPQGELG